MYPRELVSEVVSQVFGSAEYFLPYLNHSTYYFLWEVFLFGDLPILCGDIFHLSTMLFVPKKFIY